MPREIVIRHTDPEVVVGAARRAGAGADRADRLGRGGRVQAPRERTAARRPVQDVRHEESASTRRWPTPRTRRGKSKKMLFVLHISGDFEDPGFT